MQDYVGRTLGKYRLLQRIGKGGMSVVYRAFQPGLERDVAVKVLSPHLAETDDSVRRFKREAQAVAELRHPNIVQVFDFDYHEASDTYYMVMELIEGETLKARLARLNRAGQRMAPAEVVAFFQGLLAGVGYAHGQGMVHRDLKPANIMFDRNGRTVLTDFGIARILGGERFTLTGVVMGTPVYMSPEHAQGQEGDYRSDLYSLGIVLYESLSGQVPFDADTAYVIMQKHLHQPVPKLHEAVPEAAPLDPVVQRVLAKSPGARYQSAEEMWAGLRTASRKLSAAHPATQPVAPPRPAQNDDAPTNVTPATPSPASHRRITAPGRIWPLRPAFGWAAAAAVVALLLAGWLYFGGLAPARRAAQAQQAAEQMAAGDYAAALGSYEAILNGDPGDVQAHLGRGEALAALGRPDDALQEIESAAESMPNSPELLTARGRYYLLYTSGPDLQTALDDFDRAIALAPGYAPAYFARGWALLNFGADPQAALPDLREAVRLDANDSEAHRTLANALYESGEAEAALPEIVEALALKDDDAGYYVDSAVIRRAAGDLPEAVADLDAAIALRPDFSPYYAMRAYLQYEQGDYAAAIADAEAALQRNPQDAAALYARGLAFVRLTDYEKALADLDAVQAHQPFEYQSPFLTLGNLREINLDRALVLQAMPGREASALQAFDAAAAAQPDWFAVYFYRGVYLGERGDTEAARADLTLAQSLAPNADWQARAQEQLDALGSE